MYKAGALTLFAGDEGHSEGNPCQFGLKRFGQTPFPNFSFGSAWGASAMAPKTRKKKKKDPDVRMMFILPVWGKRVTWGERG